MTLVKKKGIIAKPTSLQKLIPANFSASEITEIPKALQEIIDPEKKYYLIGAGKHTLFFTDNDWLTGFDKAVNTYRVALLEEGADPQEGTPFTIGNKTFFIKGEQSPLKTYNNIKNVFNVNNDELITHSFSAVTTVPIQEFKTEYFKDFILHACIHKSLQRIDVVQETLANADSIDIENYKDYLAFWGRVILKTFSLNGNFAFSIYRRKNKLITDDLITIRQSLTGFFDEMGITYHSQHGHDELTRWQLGLKLAKRDYQKEHMNRIVSELQGDGLLKTVFHAGVSDKYIYKGFGKVSTCKKCNSQYIDGTISLKGDSDQFIDGLNLHFLARHHEDFYHNIFGNLERIARLIEDAKECRPWIHVVPTAGIEQLITKVAYWMNERFTIDEFSSELVEEAHYYEEMHYPDMPLEEEHLEDDPKLAEFYRRQKEVKELQRFTEQRVHHAIHVLQSAYEMIHHVQRVPENVHRLEMFWAEQFTYLNMIKAIGPKALTEKAGMSSFDIPANFYITEL